MKTAFSQADQHSSQLRFWHALAFGGNTPTLARAQLASESGHARDYRAKLIVWRAIASTARFTGESPIDIWILLTSAAKYLDAPREVSW